MAGWAQLFSLLKSVKDESTGALDKFNAAQQYLLKAAKGDPDPDDLRDAIVGSPLKKEIKSLKKLQTKLNKIVTPKVKMDEGLPRWTFREVLRLIAKVPELEEAQAIHDECEKAIELLLKRHAEIITLLLQMGRAEPLAKKVQANTKTLTAS